MDALPATPVFSDRSLDAEQSPRPFRVSGVVSLIFGIISVGVLASTNLLFLPVLAIVFALIAFRPARDPQVVPVGRTPAVIGAALAIFFAGWAVAQRTVQTHYMAAEGERFAKNWLAVLEDGQREFAFELTLPVGDRQLESMSLVKFYQTNDVARERFQAFLIQEPVEAIFNADEPLQWERIANGKPASIDHAEMIDLRFRDASGQIDRPIRVSLVRSEPLPAELRQAEDLQTEETPTALPVQWHVYDIQFVEY